MKKKNLNVQGIQIEIFRNMNRLSLFKWMVSFIIYENNVTVAIKSNWI